MNRMKNRSYAAYDMKRAKNRVRWNLVDQLNRLFHANDIPKSITAPNQKPNSCKLESLCVSALTCIFLELTCMVKDPHKNEGTTVHGLIKFSKGEPGNYGKVVSGSINLHDLAHVRLWTKTGILLFKKFVSKHARKIQTCVQLWIFVLKAITKKCQVLAPFCFSFVKLR